MLVTACLLKPASGLRSSFDVLVACNNFLYHTCCSCQTGKPTAYVAGDSMLQLKHTLRSGLQGSQQCSGDVRQHCRRTC